MSEPTICAKCKYYTAAIYRNYPVLLDLLAYCWHPHEEPRLDYVTGDLVSVVPVGCIKKNLGACADYEFCNLPESVFKHWWQK